ncbi:hypothetical protein B0H12DRAFT_1057539 [Mycena haematopus]|nr:hypothetical protein B0H12DRAFT_1057539 [Mycena haematopus]
MATNTAILDDRDPLIQYAGTWSGVGSYVEFYGTTTFSPEPGSTASLSFVGTSVTVYGTVGVENGSQASMGFVVDGSITGIYVPPVNSTATMHHELLWESPTLSNGTHTLVITQVAAPASTSGVIFLDYIMYDTTSTSLTYFMDDRDQRITYSSGWVQDGSDEDFQHTSQRTSATGESFTLEFEGQSISYYGGMTSLTMNASAVIDGGPPKFFGVPPGATTTNNLLFQSGDLSAGAHKLVVTAQNDQGVWTDYFLVNPITSASTSTSESASSGAPALASHTSSETSPSTTLSSSPKPMPIGVIIGCVMGIVVILATAILLFKRCRRNRTTMLPVSEPFQPMLFVSHAASGAGPMWPNGYPNLGPNGTAAVVYPSTPSSESPFVQTGTLPSRKFLQDSRFSGSHSHASTPPGSSGEEPPRYAE